MTGWSAGSGVSWSEVKASEARDWSVWLVASCWPPGVCPSSNIWLTCQRLGLLNCPVCAGIKAGDGSYSPGMQDLKYQKILSRANWPLRNARLMDVRKTPVFWDMSVVFPGYPGFPPVLTEGFPVKYGLDVGLSLKSIFFFDSIIGILFFDSDYFDLILKNCTNRIFSHMSHYLCGQDPKILKMQRQWRFSPHFLIEYLRAPLQISY